MFSARFVRSTPKKLSRCISHTDKCTPLLQGSKPFNSVEAELELKGLEGWERFEERKIRRRFDVNNFLNGVAFVNALAKMAEEEGHHPDVHLTEYKNLAVVYWSHDVGGLSKNDFICAAKVNHLWSEMSTKQKE